MLAIDVTTARFDSRLDRAGSTLIILGFRLEEALDARIMVQTTASPFAL